MQNEQIREATDTHWRASAAGDADAEHDFYEYTINYSGLSSHTVSIMEFRNGKVVQETQYFADPSLRQRGGADMSTTPGEVAWRLGFNVRQLNQQTKPPMG